MQLPPAGMGNLTCAERRPQENIAELGPSRPVGRRPRIPGLVDFRIAFSPNYPFAARIQLTADMGQRK